MAASCSPSGMTLPRPYVFLDCFQARLTTRTMPVMLARSCQATSTTAECPVPAKAAAYASIGERLELGRWRPSLWCPQGYRQGFRLIPLSPAANHGRRVTCGRCALPPMFCQKTTGNGRAARREVRGSYIATGRKACWPLCELACLRVEFGNEAVCEIQAVFGNIKRNGDQVGPCSGRQDKSFTSCRVDRQ